jgi:hypothetical protein
LLGKAPGERGIVGERETVEEKRGYMYLKKLIIIIKVLSKYTPHLSGTRSPTRSSVHSANAPKFRQILFQLLKSC